MPVRPPARGRDSSTKACHNCRRRRLRCDRSRPTCNKCFATGQECLGYDKLFVWTQWTGDGKKNDTEHAAVPAARISAAASATSAAAATIKACVTATRAANGPVPLKLPDQKKQKLLATPKLPKTRDAKRPLCDLETQSTAPLICDQALVSFYNSLSDLGSDVDVEQEIEVYLKSRAILTSALPSPSRSLDPLFQDFGLSTKRYLHHFYRVTKDIVAHDALFINPFRDIIPMALTHPVLTNAIIASSAIHMANLYQAHLIDLPDDNGIGDHCIALRSYNQTANKYFLDGLVAKQRAIYHMRSILSNLDQGGREIAIMAAFFLVNIELIDITQGGWKSHLAGASKLLATLSLEGEEEEEEEEEEKAVLMKNPIFDNVLANFFIYHILGSTLMSATRGVQIGSHILDLLPFLRRTQADSYLCCPPFMLATIPKASELANQIGSRPDADIIQDAIALIEETRHYNLKQWVDSIPSVAIFNDAADREHVAASHRAAICLYVVRALPIAAASAPVTAEALVDDIFAHMGLVSKDDVHFKGAAWPLFMAGAECGDAERRQWIMGRLMEMWSTVPWGYILRSVDMLRKTWKLQDFKRQQNAEAEAKTNWLQDLWSGDYDCLIV